VIAAQEIFLANSWGFVPLPIASTNGESADHPVTTTVEFQSAVPTSSS
jgi:hypothetical protein